MAVDAKVVAADPDGQGAVALLLARAWGLDMIAADAATQGAGDLLQIDRDTRRGYTVGSVPRRV